MEQLLTKFNFHKVTNEDNARIYRELENMHENGGIKANDVKKYLKIFGTKVCITNFSSEVDNGYYCASYFLNEILYIME